MQLWLKTPRRGRGMRAFRLTASASGRTMVAATVLALAVLAGCDADSFVPPRPEALRAAGGGVRDSSTARLELAKTLDVSGASARAVELILDRRDSEEADIVTSAARVQAGIDRTLIKINLLQVQDIPAHQAELVRDALKRNAQAIVIEPADPGDKGLADAVREARINGVPVVLVGRPLGGAPSGSAAPAEGKSGAQAASPPKEPSEAKSAAPTRREAPLTLVTAAPFGPFAKLLVDSAVRNAKNAKLDALSGAVIVFDTSSDLFVNDRIAALRQALIAAGVKKIDQIAFAKQTALGKSLLTERLKADPKITLVFAADLQSANACRETCNDLVETRPFVMAAFASESHISDLARVGDFAGVAEFASLKVLRKAISVAVATAQGRAMASRVEFPILYYDSPPDSTLATSPARIKQMKKKQ
jgi:ABC-type sugar transport system substrate-binding protein